MSGAVLLNPQAMALVPGARLGPYEVTAQIGVSGMVYRARNAGDDSGMIEYGALANVNHDRAKAEALFGKAMKKNPREFWHWVGAGASYLGVRPQ